jgi:hypothetical protein
MATMPQVSVNTVLGLLLITATGMIINFVDKVVEAKNLKCPPFKINFRCATKTVPANQNEVPTTHYIKFEDVQQILQMTDASIAGVCESLKSAPGPMVYPLSTNFPAGVRFNTNPHPSVSDTNTVTTSTSSTNRPIRQRWIPPPLAHDTMSDYHDQIFGEHGYL